MIAGANGRSRIAAFFDLDGTLIPEPSLESRFFNELRKSGVIPFTNYLRWGVEALRLLPRGLLAVEHGNKRYLTGIYRDLVFRYVEAISFFEEGIARVVWHARQSHEIVLVSGTLEALARLAATALECELEARGVQVRARICATCQREERGQWTGYLAGEVIYGPAKARALEALANEQGFDLRQCYAYGNSVLDRHLLCAVGNSHAVNPGKRLAALANEKDWRIFDWHLTRQLVSKQTPYLPKEIHDSEGPA